MSDQEESLQDEDTAREMAAHKLLTKACETLLTLNDGDYLARGERLTSIICVVEDALDIMFDLQGEHLNYD
jgi:hypothetical protein